MILELPFAALIDTSVFLCRIGDKPDDEHCQACIDFCNRMFKAGRTVFVAAPTITEVTRHKGKELPRVPKIVVAAFDAIAATELGKRMPMSELRGLKDSSGRGLGYIKYDALIVGCALRIPSCAFVGMDGTQLALAKRVGLAAYHPRDFFTASKPSLPPAQLKLGDGITPLPE